MTQGTKALGDLLSASSQTIGIPGSSKAKASSPAAKQIRVTQSQLDVAVADRQGLSIFTAGGHRFSIHLIGSLFGRE